MTVTAMTRKSKKVPRFHGAISPLIRSAFVCALTLQTAFCLAPGVVGVATTIAAVQEFEPQAVAGSLDPTFGNGGKVVTDFFGDSDEGRKVVLQPDGKIVVVGSARTSSAGSKDFGLARYDQDGSLDPSFGIGGKVTTDYFQRDDDPLAAVIQQDGKILAAGAASLNPTTTVFAVARYNTDGSLDLGFGTGGKVTISFSNSTGVFADAIAIQPDGKIVVAGITGIIGISTQLALARLNADGSLDASFGNGGKVTTALASPINLANGIALQPDGKVVVAGYTGATVTSLDFLIVRYAANGSVDPTFGAGGFVATDISGFSDAGRSMLALPDGKLIVTGSAIFSQSDVRFAMARYNADGSLDTSFGANGKVITSFPGIVTINETSALQPDGRILLTGVFSITNTPQADFALVRYNSDGSIDSSFGMNGRVTTDFSGFYDSASGLAVQPDGKIVLAGEAETTDDDSSTDFAVARYSSSPASFSLGFSQPVITADRGTKARIEILINRDTGFNGVVTVTPPDSASGIKPKPSEPMSTTESRVVFKLKIKAGAPVGAQTITFVGRSEDGQVVTATLTLNIQ